MPHIWDMIFRTLLILFLSSTSYHYNEHFYVSICYSIYLSYLNLYTYIHKWLSIFIFENILELASYLWAWLPPGWLGSCTLGLAFTHGFTFSELPEKPAKLQHLRTRWTKSVLNWYDYLAAIFVLSLGTTDIMLRVDALTDFTQ